MGPVGEDSAAPRQGANDPDAGWKSGRSHGALGFSFGVDRKPKDHKRQKPIQCVKFTKPTARHTKIRDQKPSLSDIFAQVNLMSAAPTLQNLRIDLRKRQSGKSKVPAKQRGSWPKVY